VIHPTNVNTDMIQNAALYQLYPPDFERPTAEDFAQASAGKQALSIPWIESIDVSNALLFLVSDEGRYITGSALSVDAGISVK
jgi:NAD(P)-dependent dehydrogenase (short-subunit alcohol dehydrogenase family)